MDILKREGDFVTYGFSKKACDFSCGWMWYVHLCVMKTSYWCIGTYASVRSDCIASLMVLPNGMMVESMHFESVRPGLSFLPRWHWTLMSSSANGDNDIYVIALLVWLNQIMFSTCLIECLPCKKYSTNGSIEGNSLAVPWSGLCAFLAEGAGSIPGWGTKIPQAARRGQINK